MVCWLHFCQLLSFTSTELKILDFHQVLSYYLLVNGGFVFGNVGLSVCLFVCLWKTLLEKLLMDWDEILWRGHG